MTPQELIEQDIRLVSLPEICLEVQILADSPDASAADLGRLIGKDTALSTRLLRLVNSAYFGLPRRVDTLTRAVNLIGMQELRNLTLAASAAEVFAGIDSRLFDMAAFWQHSVYCGLVARHLGEHAHVLHSERLFTAGLLHDVGRLLMLLRLPDAAGAVVSRQRETGQDICELERALIGFDHAQAGGALLSHWNLPANLCASVRHHHKPQEAEEVCLEAAILHLADAITHCAQEGWHPQDTSVYDPFGALLGSASNADAIAKVACEHADADAVRLTGTDTAGVANIIRQTAVAFDQVLDLLYPCMAQG